MVEGGVDGMRGGRGREVIGVCTVYCCGYRLGVVHSVM